MNLTVWAAVAMRSRPRTRSFALLKFLRLFSLTAIDRAITRAVNAPLRYALTAFAVSFVLLMALVALAWHIEQDSLNYAQRVSHTYRVLARLAEIRNEATQVEISTQNFRTTGEEIHLKERTDAVKRREIFLAEAQTLTLDNPAQQQHWDRLRAIIDERLAIGRRVEELRINEGAAAATRYAMTAPLRETRQRMDAILTEMSKEELRLLNLRVAALQTAQRQSRLWQFLAMAAMLATILAGAMLVRSHHRQLQLARREAELATHAKSRFLAHMSHEIRTPLSAIVGLSYLLDRATLAPDARSLVERIRSSSEGLIKLVSEVLDVSRIEADALQLESVPFDLTVLLNELAAIASPQAVSKDLAMRTRFDAAIPACVMGDPTRIRQVISNLLSNALKFTQHGSVQLTASMIARNEQTFTVQIGVIDTGIGIDPEAQKKLFEPFAQAEMSTYRRFGGSGLGLSISRQLVELMGGRIELSSMVGVGSRFTVSLPLEACALSAPAKNERAEPANAAAARPSLAGYNVLVVDDNGINREVAERILAHEGANVVTCRDGQQAVEQLRLTPNAFDVVLMDLQMPVMNGCEATYAIRHQLKLTALPIIAVTAGAIVEERDRALAAGMNSFVAKPLSPESLAAVVRAHATLTRA